MKYLWNFKYSNFYWIFITEVLFILQKYWRINSVFFQDVEQTTRWLGHSGNLAIWIFSLETFRIKFSTKQSCQPAVVDSEMCVAIRLNFKSLPIEVNVKRWKYCVELKTKFFSWQVLLEDILRLFEYVKVVRNTTLFKSKQNFLK